MMPIQEFSIGDRVRINNPGGRMHNKHALVISFYCNRAPLSAYYRISIEGKVYEAAPGQLIALSPLEHIARAANEYR